VVDGVVAPNVGVKAKNHALLLPGPALPQALGETTVRPQPLA
jgi:hypothetical protein